MRAHANENGSGTGREIRRLMDRASALLAAVTVMLALLFSAALPESALTAVQAIAYPGPLAKAAIYPSEEVPARTAAPSPDPPVIRLADVDEDVGADVLIRLINVERSAGLELAGGEPRILIYHTHDSEAYRQTPDSTYAPTGSFRTEDDSFNVYAVGEELKRILEEDYGIIAIHADEKHEKPLITTAYSRSLETMLKYKGEYPTIEMFIDLHRDGVADTGYEDDFVTVDGLECARMMFVVGTGKSGRTSQYGPVETEGAAADTPDFESNFALAQSLTETLLSYNGRFMRNIRVKSGKYNQQVSNKCLLVEVGHNGNTLEQAKNSMIYLAKAIAQAGEG